MHIQTIMVVLGMCIVCLAVSAILYYGKERTCRKKEPMNIFYTKKIVYLWILACINIMLCYLVSIYGGFIEFFIIIVLFKCKDIVSVLIQIVYSVQCTTPKLEHDISDKSIVCIIPVYDETEEEIERLVESVRLQCTSTSLICIIEDHGKTATCSVFTEILKIVHLSYVSWKQCTVNVTVTLGRVQECACVIIVKDTNMGKRDSLILSHDTFNVSRTLNETNTQFRYMLRQCIQETYHLDTFEYMFCTDADTIICPRSFEYLIETIQARHAVAACGFVIVNEPSFQFWNLVQNFQYMYGQYIRRRTESIIGKVTCLPGCITMFKIDSSAQDAIALYSEIPNTGDFFKTIVQLLGTDRRLTTSFLFQHSGVYTVFDERAKCLTNTPKTFQKYIAQRRRWGSNSYFNSLYIVIGNNIPFITRVFALLDYLRMSLIYFRCFNTVLFLIKLVYHIRQYMKQEVSVLVQLAPCMSIVLLPVMYFIVLCLYKPILRTRIVYLILGFCILKCYGTILSLVCVSNFLWYCGDNAWTSLKRPVR